MFEIIKEGLRFIPHNSTLKWIIIICLSYLFFFLSYAFIHEVPFLPLFKYAFIIWLGIEIFNSFKVFIYTPISYKAFLWMGRKLDSLNFKIAEKIGTSILVIETLIIVGLEIIIISFINNNS